MGMTQDMDFLKKEYLLADFLNIYGGGKKRRKKTYSKPKKRKNTHKKLKLKNLQYFQIDSTGSIVLTREECSRCGAGVFLANHYNRTTCGRCSSTNFIS